MTAVVEPDAASPCWGAEHWPGRNVRINHLTCVDNGDGTVTATAVPYDEEGGESAALTKTVVIADHTKHRKEGPLGNLVSVTPKGGTLRWRVVNDPEGEQVFAEKARAEARAEAINAGKVAV